MPKRKRNDSDDESAPKRRKMPPRAAKSKAKAGSAETPKRRGAAKKAPSRAKKAAPGKKRKKSAKRPTKSKKKTAVKKKKNKMSPKKKVTAAVSARGDGDSGDGDEDPLGVVPDFADDGERAAFAAHAAELLADKPPLGLPPLTDAAVVETQKTLGFRLPASYVKLLRVQNGGHVRGQQFVTGNVCIPTLHGVAPGDAFNALPGMRKTSSDWGVPRKYVPLGGDGHGWVCLDYRTMKARTSGEAPIVSLDQYSNWRPRRFAKDFDDFIEKMKNLEEPE